MADKKKIKIGSEVLELSLNQPVIRYPGNPVLTSHMVNSAWRSPGFQVVTAHNAGISRYRDTIVMLFRSHLRNGISVIGKAVSQNGIEDWKISPGPVLRPCSVNDLFAAGTAIDAQVINEAGGVEDPRISRLGDIYYITYSAYHATIPDRVRVSLATTKNFDAFTRHGPVLDADMRNVVIFPARIKNHYYALMRPNDHPEGGHVGGIFREIRLAKTGDLTSNQWDINETPVMKQSGGTSPFSHKIGPGAPPLLTRYGWLNIFHGVRATMDGNPYVLGVAFHETDDPSKVNASAIPILFPSEADCRVKESDYIHVPNVVFCCGAIRKKDGTIYIYYGGNDTVLNLAFSHEDILFELVNQYPQDPMTGTPIPMLS